MFANNRLIRSAAAAILVGLAAVPLLAQTDYVWTGLSSPPTSAWSDPGNWSPSSGYPGSDPQEKNDTAVIDDITPLALVQLDLPAITIAALFLGDGHTLELFQSLTVTTGENGGELEFDGEVKLESNVQDARGLTADYITINTNQTTIVEFKPNSQEDDEGWLQAG